MTFSTPYKGRITITSTLSASFKRLKSVSFSISFYLSDIFILTQINNQVSMIASCSYLSNYFPYIIHYFSLTKVLSKMIIELPDPKRITGEMLIAISCGCASIFFFSLAIIIMIYRKAKSKREMFDEYYYISDDDNETKEIQNENLNIKNIEKDQSEYDLKFWL